MLLTVIVLSVLLVIIAFLGLGLNIIFRKNGRFPDTEIETNPAMKNLGITCAKHDEQEAYHRARSGQGNNDKGTGYHGCGTGCCCSAFES